MTETLSAADHRTPHSCMDTFLLRGLEEDAANVSPMCASLAAVALRRAFWKRARGGSLAEEADTLIKS